MCLYFSTEKWTIWEEFGFVHNATSVLGLSKDSVHHSWVIIFVLRAAEAPYCVLYILVIHTPVKDRIPNMISHRINKDDSDRARPRHSTFSRVLQGLLRCEGATGRSGKMRIACPLSGQDTVHSRRFLNSTILVELSSVMLLQFTASVYRIFLPP